MLPDELKSRARRLPDELLTQGDLSVADELFASDCAYHAPATPGASVAGAKPWVAALRRAFPDLSAVVEAEIAEGDTVVQRITCRGTHRGEYCGLPPTGRPVSWQLVAIQRIGRDGRVAEHWACWDQLGVLRQLGAMTLAEDTVGLQGATSVRQP